MIPAFINKTQIPHKPGIYMYKNSDNRIIYVGKAIDLKSRVSSYFSGGHDPKTMRLVEEIRGIETITVESELEALILEANLIKKHLPQFNVRLMDDKGYLYIAITKDLFPKVVTTRKQDLKKFKKYWGPFPSSSTVRDTLKILRRVFPWCSGGRTNKACFYYHLNLCPGACVGLISKPDYAKIIRRFSRFLSGQKENLVNEAFLEMQKASANQEYEKAQAFKKILFGINYLTQKNRTHMYLENPNFLQEEDEVALLELQRDLKLDHVPERIEGYDISNISGTQSVGSMVVLTHGDIDKSQYRKFKIKITGRPNDVGMHREMMRRRLKNNWPMPDLIIIDGGRGQVRGVWNELQAFGSEAQARRAAGCNLPIFGLAKRDEWLYPPEGEIIKLPKRSLSLRLLQKLRDESHRFAITYHRKLRDNINV